MNIAPFNPHGMVFPLAAVVAALSACDPVERTSREPGEEPQEVQGMDQVVLQNYPGMLQTFSTNPCDSVPTPVGNEMHDCQRLVNTSTGQRQFGPLAGVMPNLSNVAAPDSFYTTPQLSALISNAGPGGYGALGIQPPPSGGILMHCLWLHNDHGTWRAAVEANGSSVDCPDAPAPGGSEWSALAVDRQTYRTTSLVDYPNTARWQWKGAPSESDGEHYIGVKCGAAWCAIGQAGQSGFDAPDIDNTENNRFRAIPGWYDAQFLAVMHPPGSSSAVLTPGPWGAVYPDTIVGTPNWSTFQRVASFELRPASGPSGGIGRYVQKLHLTSSGNPRSSWVELKLAANQNDPPEARYRNSQAPNPASPQRPVVVSSVHHGVAGSARWRWHEGDETEWVPCPYGCCDVQEA